jgi:hypothetical protein
MITIDCPCKGCTDRWIDTETLTRCHSSCSKYVEYKKRIDDINNQLKEERDFNKFSFGLTEKRENKKANIRRLKRRKRLYRTA